MSTLKEMRSGVFARTQDAVHGRFSFSSLRSFRVYRDSKSGYTDEFQGSVRAVTNLATSDAGDIFFTADPNRIINGLRPGEKGFQLRFWMIEQDEEVDSNTPATNCGIEIEVHRRLKFPDEETLYTRDEMLDNMSRLLDKTAWRAVAEIDALIEGPAITDVPTRENDVLKYTVALIATVAP